MQGDVPNAGVCVLLDRQTMHPEERELVKIAPLKSDAAVAHCEEAASTKAEWVSPLERHDLASFVNHLRNAGHISDRKVTLEHLSDCDSSFDRLLYDLMIHRVLVVEVR